MVIRIATQNEYAQLVELDDHISTEMLADQSDQGEILVVMENMSVIGWLRYGYFWDKSPFYEYADRHRRLSPSRHRQTTGYLLRNPVT